MTRRAWHLSAAVAFCILLVQAAPAGAAAGGNGFYRVVVQDFAGSVGIGVYTVQTGPLHPVTGSYGTQDILFGGGLPGTSYTTIRSYTSGDDYAQRGDNSSLNISAGAPTTHFLEQFAAPGEEAVPVGDPNNPSGFITTYRIGAVAPAPDDLTVVQEVSASGADFNTSSVKIRTSITNNGASAVSVGVRYLWDFQIGQGDDGPTFRQISPDGPALSAETDFPAPGFQVYLIQDNNDPADVMCFSSNTPFPFYIAEGSVLGPVSLHPTPPTRLAFVDWLTSSALPGGAMTTDAFDYTPSGVDSATCTISDDDTAVMSWWGDDASDALTIPAGGMITVAAYVFAGLPGTPPMFPGVEGPPGDPTCSDGVDNDGDGLVDLMDPDCQQPGGDQPPDCSSATPSRREIWPPNHKFRSVGIRGITDPDGDPVSIQVTGITQDEPLNGKGDGNTSLDAKGVGASIARVRAERSSLRDGRVYHISFTAEDGAGGQCSGEVSVCVPHDRRRGHACVDEGPLYDSTQAAP